MANRIKTSKNTNEKLIEINNRLKLSSKASVLRIALSLSLNLGSFEDDESIEDSEGFDISISTLFGETLEFYHALMKINYGRRKFDNDLFTKLVKKHIDRGMKVLYAEFATTNNYEEFITGLLGK